MQLQTISPSSGLTDLNQSLGALKIPVTKSYSPPIGFSGLVSEIL